MSEYSYRIQVGDNVWGQSLYSVFQRSPEGYETCIGVYQTYDMAHARVKDVAGKPLRFDAQGNPTPPARDGGNGC